MPPMVRSSLMDTHVDGCAPYVDLGALGFDEGAHILVDIALERRPPGHEIDVRGTHRDLAAHLDTWCRQQGHRVRRMTTDATAVAMISRGATSRAASIGAQRAGAPDPSGPGAIAEHAEPAWGLAARGAAIEPGGPAPSFRLSRSSEVWTDRAPALYRQAVAAQWDPATAIDWSAQPDHPEGVEAAIVQVMTFLIENEEAALVVPARFLAQVHPHFREIQQVLAVNIADEARHIEVFTRRATMSGAPLALSTVGGRASLQTLLDEPDYATASFLLSVMGEGTFMSLLGFLELYAPDAITRRIAHLARNDEARHVAFAMEHLERHIGFEPALRTRLAGAVERRHDSLRHTAGLNEAVFDALVVLAAGETTPAGVATGWRRVQALHREMAESRRLRLARLGFSSSDAETIAALHTRNFM
jgi:hypothetical protein